MDSAGERNLLDESDPGLQWLHAMWPGCTWFMSRVFGSSLKIPSLGSSETDNLQHMGNPVRYFILTVFTTVGLRNCMFLYSEFA